MKQFFKNQLFRIYRPVARRVEVFRAWLLWRDGVRSTRAVYREINSPRVYMFWDSSSHCFVSMTYDGNRLYKPAFRQLRTMGKIRGKNLPRNVEDMKAKAFYYTESRHGAKSVDDDNSVRTAKLQQWIAYYLDNVSPIWQKVLLYQQSHLS